MFSETTRSLGDLGIADAACHQSEHLELPFGQLGQLGRALNGTACELGYQSARHAGGEERAAGGHDTDRGAEPLLGGVFQQEAAGTGTRAS